MITKRIIPCLDVRDGRVVKGTNFEGIKDVADPVEMARLYNAAGADELVFYDITASFEGRALFTDILTRVAGEIFIPLTVGGGINTLEDFDRVLKCGADKVSVNSGALKDPGLIPAAAQRYGDQCVVLSADIKRVDGKFMLFANTSINFLLYIRIPDVGSMIFAPEVSLIAVVINLLPIILAVAGFFSSTNLDAITISFPSSIFRIIAAIYSGLCCPSASNCTAQSYPF